MGPVSQQLVEGLRGLPVVVLTAGALPLHNAVVLAAEPAGRSAGDRWRFLILGSLVPAQPSAPSTDQT